MTITHLDCVRVGAVDLENAAREWETLLGRSGERRATGYRIGLANSALEIVNAVGAPGLQSLVFASDGESLRSDSPRGTHDVIQRDSPPVRVSPRSVADPASAVGALDHVVIRSEHLDACLEHYASMGLRLALDRIFPERGVRLAFFRFGHVTLELSGAHPPPPRPARGNETQDRLWGLAWRVPSVEAARRRLAACGIAISEFREGHKAGTRVFTVPDAPCEVPTLVIEDPSRDDAIP